MSRRFIKRKSGLTLIETVVYVLLFALLAMAVMQVLLVLSKSFSHARDIRGLTAGATASFERMTREIELADTIVTAESVFGSSPGTLVVQYVGPDDVTKTEKFYRGTDGDLLVQENSGTPYPLTPSDIDVSSLVFRQITSASSSAIKIELTLEKAGATSTRASYYVTSVLRGTYE